jgi:hypothetical protein
MCHQGMVPGANGVPVPVSDSAAHRKNPISRPHGRQRAFAGIPPLHSLAVLSKMTDLSNNLASDFVSGNRDHYAITPGTSVLSSGRDKIHGAACVHEKRNK